jgi:hypothetical protein
MFLHEKLPSLNEMKFVSAAKYNATAPGYAVRPPKIPLLFERRLT